MTPTEHANTFTQEVGTAVARLTPPASVALWNKFSAIPAADWLTYLSIAYLLLQAFILIRDKLLRKKK